MGTCIVCTPGNFSAYRKFDINPTERIVAVISVVLSILLGMGTIFFPVAADAQESVNIRELYDLSEPCEDIIKNGRKMSVLKGSNSPISGSVPFYTNDDWFKSYENPSRRVQAKKVFKKQGDFDFNSFDKLLKTNRKNLYRIYFYADDGFVSMQFINGDYAETITIPLSSSIIREFLY